MDEEGYETEYVHLVCGELGVNEILLPKELVNTPGIDYRYFIYGAEGRCDEELLDGYDGIKLAKTKEGKITGSYNGYAMTGVPILIELSLDPVTRIMEIKGWGWSNATLLIKMFKLKEEEMTEQVNTQTVYTDVETLTGKGKLGITENIFGKIVVSTKDRGVAFGVHLTEVKRTSGEIITLDKPKQFVPSFDKDEEDAVLILQFSVKDGEEKDDIKLIAQYLIESDSMVLKGEGFEEATFNIEIQEIIHPVPETEVTE